MNLRGHFNSPSVNSPIINGPTVIGPTVISPTINTLLHKCKSAYNPLLDIAFTIYHFIISKRCNLKFH